MSLPPDSIRALLVEDNPADARLVYEACRAAPAPYVLTQAASLGEAFACLVEAAPDVVLLDLSLPDTQGLNTYRLFRETAPEPAVVLLTGLEDDQLALEALGAGAQDYLVKGRVDWWTLARAIRHAIQRKRLEREQGRLIAALEAALADVKTLRGLLPICATCKMIRDANGEWFPIETYLGTHSEAEFTHGYCPRCSEEFLDEVGLGRRRQVEGSEPA